jgi:hypothetical protein
MQIFEITQPRAKLPEQPEYTTPAGIIIPQGVKTAAPAPAAAAAAAPAAAAPAAAAPAAAASQGRLARAAQATAQATKAAIGRTLPGQFFKGAQAAQNTDMLAKAMLKQWNTKAAQLANAAAATGTGTVSDQEYKEQLEDFVEKNMLQKQIDELDSTSTQRMNQMIAKVVASRNNSSQLDQAFRDMAKITTTARMDPSLRRFGGRAAATPTAAQGQPGAQQAPQATAQTLMPSSAQQTDVLAHFGGRGARFQSTNNANVDAFLQQLGLRMTP